MAENGTALPARPFHLKLGEICDRTVFPFEHFEQSKSAVVEEFLVVAARLRASRAKRCWLTPKATRMCPNKN